MERSNLKKRETTHEKQVVRREFAATYSGPLPLAEDFRKYEEVCHGAADRIITMAEKQAAHRQAIETKEADRISRNSIAGIMSALAITFTIVGSGVYCIINGHDVAGCTLIGGELVSLVTTFIWGTNAQKRK